MAWLIAPPGHLKLLRRLDEPALVTKFLGDSLLGVGFADDKGRYVDTHGQPIQLPPVGSRRVATVFERDVGRPVMVHDRSLLTDGLLMEAISSKPGSQLRMLGSTRRREPNWSDLVASRHSLLTADDEERSRLSQRLHTTGSVAVSPM